MTRKKDPSELKKKGPKPIEFDYDEVAFFCRSQITQQQLARKLHISDETLRKRLKTDPKLREAMDGGQYDGQNIVQDAMFKKMLDRYMTVCKDCQKIRFSYEGYYESCPYCDKNEPVDPETGESLVGKHTNVRHKFIPGSENLMIFWSKNHLGMSDRVTHEGNDKKPLVFQTLADYALARAAARKKDAEERSKKQKGEAAVNPEA